MSTKNQAIIEALKKVQDPELDIDVYSLGLVYDIEIRGEAVTIVHTLTSPMCPMGPQIQADMRSALVELGYQDITIELTFDPPWQAPEDLRDALGI